MTRLHRMVLGFLDDEVDAHVVVLSDHHAIHDGYSFVNSGEVVLASSATRDIRIVVPDSPYKFHFLAEIDSSAECNYLLYEGANLSGGTNMNIYNRNRNSLNLPLLVMIHTPTVISLGTLIHEVHFGRGQITGGTGRSDEFILKNNTTYLLRITSEAASNDVSWILNYYYYKSALSL